MALCGLAALLAVVLVLTKLGVRGRPLYAAAALFALSPLAVGPISLNTYDLFPAALTVGALAALLSRRDFLAFGLLGLAVTAKVYPLVLVPPAAAYVWARAGRRSAVQSMLILLGVVVVVIAPFAVLAPGGLWDSFQAQSSRGLQIESLGGALLLAAHRLGLYDATVVRGSTGAATRDLGGSLAGSIATLISVVQIAAVTLVWALYARVRRNPEALVLAFAAAVTGFVVFNRFLSPQYLVWLVPLVLLLAGRTRLVAVGLLALALLLGQIWFFHYRDVFALERIVWLVVVRDALLLALFSVLVVRLWKTSTPSSEKTSRQRGLRRSRASPVAVANGSHRSA
jgi:Glycosyltransferase family 87